MGRFAPPNLSRTARWFHALSDETRIQILERLAAGEQCVCDLTDFFQTGQSRLSFHLKTLKDAGILLDRREGRWVYYSINAEALEEMMEVMKSLASRSAKTNQSKCCE